MMGIFRRLPRWGGGMLLILFAGLVLYLYPQANVSEEKGLFTQKTLAHEPAVEPEKAKALPVSSFAAPVFLKKENAESRDLVSDLMAREKGEDVRALFAWLTQTFGQVADLVGHLDAVRGWLMENYDAESAEAILAVYEPYIRSEMELAEYLAVQSLPRTREARLAFWEDIRNFRIAYMGEVHTEWLFGREMAESRYRTERVDIVSDPGMTSSEKLQALEKLDAAYAAEREEGPPVSQNAYQQYRELLEVHKRDLAHMASDGERQERIRTLRLETFPEDVVARMEAAEYHIRTEEEREKAYRNERNSLAEDSRLDAEEKNRQVEQLQARYFGEDAESIRRRERIAAALQERMDAAGQRK